MPDNSTNAKSQTFIIIGIGLLIGSIVVVCLLATASSYVTLDDCKTVEGDPIAVASCLSQFCLFDANQCQINCPLGFKMDDKGCPVSCDCASSGLMESDIQFEESQVPQLINQLSETGSSNGAGTSARMGNFDLFAGSAAVGGSWLDLKDATGSVVIPFRILNDTFPNIKLEGAVIREAIERYHKKTCIKFIPYDEKNPKHKHHLFFQGKKPGCWSYVGKISSMDEGQAVNLGNGCVHVGVVVHEILHALSFMHEQMRPDRDSFVTVHKENLKESVFKSNFKKMGIHQIVDLKSEYDRDSIMHYGGYSFSINTEATLTNSKTGEPVKSQRIQMTDKDIEELQNLYECTPKTSAAAWSNWGEWSEPGVTCGTATLTRFRKCQDNKQPASGCDGDEKEIKNEELESCPSVPEGTWSEYGEWSDCTKTCSSGIAWRIRKCEAGSCDGFSHDFKHCNTPACDGALSAWTEWSSWTECSQTCGKSGFRRTHRQCLDQDEKFSLDCGHSDVEGKQHEWEKCFVECGSDSGGMRTASDSNFRTITRNKFVKNKKFPNICENGDGDFLFGDFNQDGITDLMCSLTKTTFKQYHGKVVGDPVQVWKGELTGCENPQTRFIKDANGDGVPDFICFNAKDSTITTKFSDDSGILDNGTPIDLAVFCNKSVLALPIKGDHEKQQLDFICRLDDYDKLEFFKRS